MEDKFARIGVHLRQRIMRCIEGTLGLNIRSVNMPHRRLAEEILLRGIEPLEPEEGDIRLAHQRRLAPKPHQLRRALTDNVGHDHSVDAARGSARGSIEIGVAIEPQKIQVFVIAPRAGEQANNLGAVAAEDQQNRAALHGKLGTQFQIIETSDDLGQIAGAPVFLVIREEACSAVAVINNFVACGLEFFDDSSSAQCSGSFFRPWRKTGGAKGRANQGNFLRLTDDLDRQGLAPCFIFTAYICVPMTKSFTAPAATSCRSCTGSPAAQRKLSSGAALARWSPVPEAARSEEHTSELQSQSNLVCRLLLDKKNVDFLRKRSTLDLSLRSSSSSYFATFRHQLTILSKTDALDEEKWLNMLGTFVKDWFRYESHFVHGRDSLVDILKERGLLSESDAVQPLIGKKS